MKVARSGSGKAFKLIMKIRVYLLFHYNDNSCKKGAVVKFIFNKINS